MSAYSQVSRGVGHWIVDTFVPFLSERLETMPVEQLELLHTLLRKAGHFSEYFILGILAMLTVLQTKLRYGNEYSCAVTPPVRQTGNRLSRPTETACASLLA